MCFIFLWLILLSSARKIYLRLIDQRVYFGWDPYFPIFLQRHLNAYCLNSFNDLLAIEYKTRDSKNLHRSNLLGFLSDHIVYHTWYLGFKVPEMYLAKFTSYLRFINKALYLSYFSSAFEKSLVWSIDLNFSTLSNGFTVCPKWIL